MTDRRQFGSIRRLPSRRLQASYWFYGMRHVAPQTFGTRTEASDWLTTEKAKVLQGSWIDPSAGNATFAAIAAQWQEANPGKRESTVARDEIALRLHIVPYLGDRRLAAITPVDVQKLVNRWSQIQAPATCRRTYDVLRAIFSYSVRADLLVRTPCRGIHLPAIQPAVRDLVTPEQVATIAGNMPVEYRALAWLGAVVGLRWGEAAGLRVRRVDLLGKSLTVTEQITRGRGGRPMVSPPKSHAGNRTIAIPGVLATMLAEHIARRGLTGADPNEFLFVNDKGGPLDYTNFRRRVWQPAVRDSGLPGVGFHDLRRAAATALVTERVDIKTAQVRLGHSDPRLTLAIYAQATTDADRAAAENLGSKFFTNVRSA